MTERLEVRTVTDAAGLAELRDDWGRLLEASPAASIFSTWEWLDAWWSAYGGGRTLAVHRVYDGGTLIGIVPTYTEADRRLWVLGGRAAVLLGDGSWDSDYLDVVALPGREADVLSAFLERRREGGAPWRILRWNEVPEGSRSLESLREHCRREGWFLEESTVDCPYVEFPGDWDAYLATLKPRMRTKVRSLQRNLEASHALAFDRCADAADLDPRLDSLFELHARRWSSEGQAGVFASPAKRGFYRDMSRRFLERDWLRFYSLAVDGTWRAHQFCFERRGTMYLLQEGYDPAWQEHGVGNVLRALVFRDCIQRGVAVYDFLGGVTPHKLSWGANIKRSRRLTAGPRGVRNSMYFLLPRALRWVRTWVRAARGAAETRAA